MMVITESLTLALRNLRELLRQKIENFTYSIRLFLDELSPVFWFFFSWIYLHKYLLPCLFFQAFAPSVLFLLDFPVVAWSRSSSDSVHKVWNKSDGEGSNSEANLPVRAEDTDPSAESTRLILLVPGQIQALPL